MKGRHSAPALLFGLLASLALHLVLLGLDGGGEVPAIGAALPVVLVAAPAGPPATAAAPATVPLAESSAVSRSKQSRTLQAVASEPATEGEAQGRRELQRTGSAPSTVAESRPEAITASRMEQEAGAGDSVSVAASSSCAVSAAGQELVATAVGQPAASNVVPAVPVAGRSAVVAGEVPAVRVAPRYRFTPPPLYPALARSRGWQGDVELWVRVAEDGRVLEARVHDSSGFEMLDRAAVDAVGRWRFHPARIGQTPVPTEVRVPVCFRLPH